MRILALFCVLMYVAISPSLAQSNFQLLAKINHAMEQLEQVRMTMTYKVYAPLSKQVVSESKGSYWKWRKCSKTHIGDLLTVQNDKYLFTVDEEEQALAIDKVHANNASMLNMPKLDSAQLKYVTMQQSKITAEQSRLSMMIEDAEALGIPYERIEVYYHPKNYYIQKVSFYYAEAIEAEDNKPAQKYRMEMTIESMDVHSKFSTSDFSEKAYFTEHGTSLVATEAYHHYKIVDLRLQKGKKKK